MTWHSDEGFHLEAFLDNTVKIIEKVDIGKIGITPKSDFCSIRMRPQGYDWAIAPNIRLSSQDKLDINQSRYLSINFGRLVFCESVCPITDGSIWTGSALYETKSKLSLSDEVYTETRINDQKLGNKWEVSGICYEDEQNRKLIGNFIDDKHLKLYWKLPKKQFWSKSESWQWNIAIQDVLSIWFGETVRLLQRSFLRDAQKITEIRQKTQLSNLGLLSPFWELKFDKQAFIHLTDFFVRDSSKADICRRIFWQLVEASNQKSRQSRELLLSTILEASLRSIDNRPFKNGDNSWDEIKSLKKFFSQYLISEDDEYVNRVKREYFYLRNRNAHPDWLFSQGGSLSEEEQAKSLDSMIFLSRFYGYMILALAGFRDLRPNFPTPHKDWKAAATVTVGSNTNTEDALTGFMLETTLNLVKQLEEKNYHEKIIFWRNHKKGIV
ncbi:MAG: hypothetical protein ACK59J_04885 [Pseudanabaena sp.]|jgi:hypothetical protein